MTTTPNKKVAKQPEGLDFHNRRSSTCGSNLPNNCLKGRTNYYYFNLRFSPAFQAENIRVLFRRSSTCGYENQALRAIATPNE
ncbi:MAG: hypothetical protein LBR10_07835 [Prevotellaceae bacterium]|jgi:hypothetical protein|nr:hypothetical protein [Prevotellaceae bacterium]